MQIELPDKSYCAKTLLFGEYTIIDGGTALSVPFRQFSGSWASNEEGEDLTPFFNFLKTLSFLNAQKIEHVSSLGWIFKSTVPQGYGLGSSASLTAAAYELFCDDIPEGILHVKENLATIESFFHGKSSGLDPLSVFFNRSILSDDGEVSFLDLKIAGRNFFLYDSQMDRDTKAMISIYMDKKADPSFEQIRLELETLNKRVIKSLRMGYSPKNDMHKISEFQFDHFQEMIPNHIAKLWHAGLKSKKYFMKLSGAGGGGYFLIYAVEEINKTGLDQNLILKI